MCFWLRVFLCVLVKSDVLMNGDVVFCVVCVVML